jgi:hypothetical protein
VIQKIQSLNAMDFPDQPLKVSDEGRIIKLNIP